MSRYFDWTASLKRFVRFDTARSEDVNDALDELTAGLDDLDLDVNRSIKLPSGTADQTLALGAGARANKVLAFDGSGNITVSTNDVDTSAASAAAAAASAVTAASEADAAAAEADEAAAQVALAAAQVGLATAQAGIATAQVAELEKLFLGAKASDPSLDNEGNALVAGALYLNTTTDATRVYDGSSWQDVGSTVNGTSARYSYTAAAAQTTFAAVYDVGFVDVYLNGIKLAPADFTATNGTSIVLATGAALNDTVDIVGYGSFELANHYTKPETDALIAAKQDTLVSGTSIKTVNGTSLLGSGDVAVQATLVSGTNIKTVGGASLLGSGDVPAGMSLAFTSAEQTITLSGLLTIAHGLGVKPTIVETYQRCKTAEAGYSIGDEVLTPVTVCIASARGYAVTSDATNIYVRMPGAAAFITDKSSGATTVITTANWRILVKAYK